MRLTLALARAQLAELVRTPAFVLPLAILPTVLYLAFGVPRADAEPRTVMLGFVAFAILGTMLFEFGVGMAARRDDPWTRYLASLGAGVARPIVAQLLCGAVLAALACVPLVVVATLVGVPPPEPATLPAIAAAVAVGAVAHGLLGVALGAWLPARGAVGITNVLYVPLAYLGGLLGGVGDPLLAAIGRWTPTGAWTTAMRASVDGVVDLGSLVLLTGFAVAFAAVARGGLARARRTRYR